MMDENYEFVIKPVLDKHNMFFTIKRDRRKKKKPVLIEFKMNGGTISGWFELKQYKHTTRVFDTVTSKFIPFENVVVFDD